MELRLVIGARTIKTLRALVGLAALGATLAGAQAIDEIDVLYRADALGPGGSLSAVQRGVLAGQVGTAFTELGHTADGAFRLGLVQPLGIDDARLVANRLRVLPQVLYVKLSPIAAASPADVAAMSQSVPRGPPVSRMIVKYRDATVSALAQRNGTLDTGRLASIAGRLGQAVAHERAMSGGAWVVRLLRAVSVDEAGTRAQDVAADPAVEYAEPDLPIQAALVPNDPYYATDQWDLMPPAASSGGSNLPPAWALTTGSSGVFVAVIDTGLLPHPDLAGRYVGGYDMISDALVANDGDGRDPDPSDPGDWITAADAATPTFTGCPVRESSWHGTHVAGTIGAATNDALGVAGINWVSQILPMRVLGKCFGYTSDIADAIVWAVGLPLAGVPLNAYPARVLNLSLGGSSKTCGSTFQNAINSALGAGAVVVVAAGNSNADASGSTPANCAGVITVAATQGAGARASYSNYGALVEIAAPGGGDGNYILSTLNHGATTPDLTPSGWYYEYYQGTSMATPHVAGIASLMLSRNPLLTPGQVLAKIQATARAFPTGTGRDCTTALCGAGIIDAGAAVQAASAAITTTTLMTSAAVSTFGVAVTFTAMVTGSAPTGTVAFFDSGTAIPDCSARSLGLVGGSYVATCATATLVVGTHAITATYSGDAANDSSSSAALTQVVNKAPTTTFLSTSLNPSGLGTSVTFTATVAGSSPTGPVAFRDGGAAIVGCAARSLALVAGSYVATCKTSALTAGTHAIAAVYAGDANNGGSASASLNQIVNAVTTTTVLSSSPNPSKSGEVVTFTATVTGSAPTGTVAFRDGASAIAGCGARSLTLVAGSYVATCKTAALAAGTHSVAAAYSGDANNAGSASASLNQVVATVTTTTALDSSPDPSKFGQVVMFTATVTGTAPTGAVAFRDGGLTIGGCAAESVVVVAGSYVATCATAALAVGTHAVTATYSGDDSNGGSTSAVMAQVVNAAPTTTVLNSNLDPSGFGAIVRFTATVAGVNPTGTVSFVDGGVTLPGCDAQPLAISGASFAATCATAALAVGIHSVSATYGGDGNNAASASAALAQTIASPGAQDGSADSRNYVQKAYVAYYGRPADPAGQTYWALRMDAEGHSLNSIIDAFGTSDEFNRRYLALGYVELVTTIYQQTLGRSPDTAGLDYYVGELQAGRRTLQSVALDVLNGATLPPDSTVIVNRLDVADYYTAMVAAGCPYGAELDGVNSLATVTPASATVAAAKAAIDNRCAP